MKGYHLSFYRHGLTRANEEGIYIGTTDLPLSDRGAAELAGKLDLYDYPKVQRVYSSPLTRCTETAEILFPDVPLYLAEELRELNFGAFEGKSALELVGQTAYREWLKGGSPEMHAPEGESVEELCIRSYRAVYRILMDMMEQDFTHCAVITHAGVISNLLACFGMPKIPPRQLHCAAGEGFEVLLTAQMWQTAQAFEILGMTPYAKE